MRPETATAHKKTRLADYRPPDWLVEHTDFRFDLTPDATRVAARIAFRRNPTLAVEGPADLVLDGRALTLISSTIDGEPVNAETTDEGLRVPAAELPDDAFVWTCETQIDPAANTELEGLYLSRGMFCTQCEAEGFRKITYYPDRPDVMAPFRVRIEADRAAYPILLSNGNSVAAGQLDDGRHFAEWEDPHPKPAYLFALVAGDLVSHDDSFTTASGREVALKIYVRPGDEGKCTYAMESLKRSMRWDEEVYGREYDLDLFMIVAVDDFNMGAMENKGLNIFNSKYVLASPETATDRDYKLIEGIVAHEYFHNWTGNRITCRDWFQLCLKEGLTVFRDQQFSADMWSAAVKRIEDVQMLRARQFREDQGPLAHPVRPEEYVEINNFYTATVYEKGAEVIRMLRTLVGAEGYRKALDLYFQRHDGQACTIEQFRECFEDACGRDLSRFAHWWSQAGTPCVKVHSEWDGDKLTLHLSQNTPPTPGQPDKNPLIVPISLGVIGPDGSELVPTMTFEFDRAEQVLEFAGIGDELPERARAPVASILRGFSAPVIIEREMSDAESALLLAHDSDPFNRWEAGRRYAIRIARNLVNGGSTPDLWLDSLRMLAADAHLDPAFRAMALELPGDDEMAREIAATGSAADPDAIHAALRVMRQRLGDALADVSETLYGEMRTPGPYVPEPDAAGRRALKNRCLALITAADRPHGFALAEAQFKGSSNMSDALPALTVLVHEGAPLVAQHLDAFYSRWHADPLVVDKWLALQASAPLDETLDRVDALTRHAAFDWKNPNKFRSLIGVLAAANPVVFHRADGASYHFVADWLIRLDALNPQTTARIAACFETFRRYDETRQGLIRGELERMAAVETLSRNTREMVERMLG